MATPEVVEFGLRAKRAQAGQKAKTVMSKKAT
jgi:hypothetical protein